MSKKCSKCGETKELESFHKNGIDKLTKVQQYASACKPCKLESKRRIYHSDIENSRKLARERMAKNAHKHRDSRREYAKKRRAEDPQAARDRDNAKYAKNPESKKRSVLKWSKKFPEKKRAIQERRRARKAGAVGACTSEQWQARLDYYGGKCVYCGSESDITQEHRIPLSRGGTHFPANLVPACHSCNCRKNTKTETEYKNHLISLENAV